MTTSTAEDKSLWSAAKSLYAADRARHAATPVGPYSVSTSSRSSSHSASTRAGIQRRRGSAVHVESMNE